MPELPEVETVLRGIAPHVTGKTVREVILRDGRLRRPVPPDLPEILSGQTAEEMSRRGKYLLLRFDTGLLLIHLGMSGTLRLIPTGTPAQKHEHIDLVFDDVVLRYRDPRRFGLFSWFVGVPEFCPDLCRLGVEPLSDDFDADFLYARTRGGKAAIKNLLLQGNIVAGIGNIYANEALFDAGIHPALLSGSLKKSDCLRLVRAVKEVLRRAIAAGGSTLRDFVAGDGSPGHFQQQYRVYGREHLPCPRCGTPTECLRLAGRSSFYCPRCQAKRKPAKPKKKS